jgi:Domain of unknown function (DUF4272)
MVDVTTLEPAWIWNLGEEEFEPPSIERQIKRMFCLTALTILFDSVPAIEANPIRAEPDTYHKAVEWILANGQDELTDGERKFIETNPQQWTTQQSINASWTFQAAATIGYSLGLVAWRPIWESFEASDFDFRFLQSTVESVTSKVAPRPANEVGLMNSVSCAWLWRCRNEWLQKPGLLNRMRSKRHLAKFVTDLDKSGQFDAPIDGDFNVNGTAFRSLSRQEQSRIGSKANERLRALNWLHGQDPDYDLVSCDT